MNRSIWALVALCACLVGHARTAHAEDEAQPTAPPPPPEVVVPADDIGNPPPPPENPTVVEPDANTGAVILEPTNTVSGPRFRRRTTPVWRFRLEGAISVLDDPDGNLGEPAAGLPALTWGANNYDPAFGMRGSIARCWGDGELEARIAFLGGWDDSTRQTGAFGFANVFGASPTATTTLRSMADFVSLEANYWHNLNNRDADACGPWFRVGAGIRFFKYREIAEARDWVGLAPDSFLNGEADNSFIGGQILGSAGWVATDCVELEVSGRLFAGLMSRDITIDETSILSGGSKRATSEEDEFSWGAEIGIDASFKVTNCTLFTVGYSLIYLNDVARAHDTLDFSRGNTGAVQAVQRTDSVLIHSIYLGLEFRL